MRPAPPKSPVSIVRLAIGLVVCSGITMLLLAAKLRQNQCLRLTVPIDFEITIGRTCPRPLTP